MFFLLFFKQKTAYVLRISDWSADVCSSDLLRVGDEVGRKITAIELHAFDDVELELEALGLLDRDHAFLADLVHRLGDLLADDGVAVGRDDADLGDLVGTGDGLGAALEVLDDLGDGEIDAALQVHRVQDRKSTRLNSS